jgi:hypothetical protein
MKDESRRLAASRPAEWLSFAATPTFALMAVLAGAPPDGGHQMSCSAAAMTPLGGMPAMYVLMSVFHVSPWLKVISRWLPAAQGSPPGVASCDGGGSLPALPVRGTEPAGGGA